MEGYIGILGLVVILGIAYAASLDRKAIKPRIIVWGLALQFTFALFVMKIPVGMAILTETRRRCGASSAPSRAFGTTRATC